MSEKWIHFIDKAKKDLINKEKIDHFVDQVAEHIDEVYQLDDFYNFPIEIISSILQKIDFSSYEHYFSIMQGLTTRLSHHFPTNSSIFLHQIKAPKFLTLTECVELLKCFERCSLCKKLGELYREHETSVGVDYEFEIAQKDKQISILKSKLYIVKERSKKIFSKEIEDEIFQAVKFGDLDKLISLTKGKEDDFYVATEYGETPLHFACLNDNFMCVEYLVKVLHSDPEAVDNNGKTPLHCACENNGIFSLQFLCEECHVNTEAKMSNGNTPLCIAASNNHIDIVEYLINHGADINGLGYRNETPLMKAAMKGNIEIVKLLLSSGANPKIRNIDGKTAYDVATDKYVKNIIKKESKS